MTFVMVNYPSAQSLNLQNNDRLLHGQVTSTENNAAFNVLTPNGKVVRQEIRKVDMILPDTGDFQIVVGGTRGNATYRLNIGVD